MTWRQKALFDRKIASRGDFKWERDRYTLRNNLIHNAKKFKTFSETLTKTDNYKASDFNLRPSSLDQS